MMKMENNNMDISSNGSQSSYKQLKNIDSIQISHNVDTENNFKEGDEYVSEECNTKSGISTNTPIVSAFDVANAILQYLNNPISTMKLHKLLYYCQAWNLVWEEKPLFKEKVEAWANGPVVREVFNYHKGLYQVSLKNFLLGNSDLLSKNQKDNIESVLKFYGDKSAQWLIDQTHSEKPWISARSGLAMNERGDVEIPLDEMADYYSSLR